MSNVFLNGADRDVETAIMLDKATITNIGNAVAFTDGKKVFINTDENLTAILPSYNVGMLKWLLWHERMHMELKHHNRFFKYLSELKEDKCVEEFQLDKSEVNIIMDILVHDSLSKMFPELVETALANLAQMRNRNSLKYTFETFNLEDMLEEYRNFKKSKESEDKDGEGEESKDKKEDDSKEGSGSSESEQDEKDADSSKKDATVSGDKKGHTEGGHSTSSAKSKDKDSDEVHDTPEHKDAGKGEHDKTDWSKLADIDDKEFITEEEAKEIDDKVMRLREKKIKLGRLSQRLNGLATTTRQRTYRIPSYIQVNKGIILKGKLPGKTDLYLVFDASGSMRGELKLFKELITKAIPQALDCPCEWFSGYAPDDIETKCRNREGRSYDYFKGKYRDILDVTADSGYDDDGDRVIELCLKAEEKGYTPIGVTDGGGCIDDPETLRKLKRTILVGSGARWLEKAKSINPNIQTLHVDTSPYRYDED